MVDYDNNLNGYVNNNSSGSNGMRYASENNCGKFNLI